MSLLFTNVKVRDILWIGSAFLFGKLLLFLGYPSLGIHLLNPELWVRWDSAHYFSIAEKGYETFPCWTRFHAYPPGSDALCGNCGWMPGFPLLIALFSGIGLSAATGAQVIVNMCFLAFLSFLRFRVLKHEGSKDILLLFAAASWPGAVYFQAAFPIALFVLCVGLCIHFLRKEKLLPAMLGAAGASLAYSTGFLLAAAVFPYIVFRYRNDVAKLIRYMLVPLASLLSFGAVLWFQWKQTGVAFAFFLTQTKYGHGVNSPLKILGLIARRALSAQEFHVQVSDILTLTLTAGFILLLIWYWMNTTDVAVKCLLTGYLLCFWFLPLSMSPHLAFYRQVAALVPLVLFLEAVPRRALIFLVGFSICINPVLTRFFLLDLLP
jgi:hypothetical protein